MSPDDHVSTARAVFDASVDGYVRFVGTELTGETESPIDRSLLGAFVELVGANSGAAVADVGCGPGRIAAYLAVRGLDVVGFDVSPGMLAVAKRAHPELRFDLGQLDALPVGAASFAGAVCWYSIIYTPPKQLEAGFAEMARVLGVDGVLLLAFQAGDGEAVHRPDAFETGLPLTSYRHDPDDVARGLAVAGLDVRSTTVRSPEPEYHHETTPQAFVFARRA
jgi:SAM-dependent methyltransferase